MIDPEISAADALRLLSVPGEAMPDEGPIVGGWSRRRFLQAVALGVGAGLTLGSLGEQLFGHDVPEAWAGTPIGANDGILINIILYGGNDGLNTVVPYTDGSYYNWRKGGTSIAANTVLPLDAAFGLHPSLPYVKALWDAGELAVIHGVGYNPPDLSHFTSTAIWMNGSFAGPPTTGWLGRWLDGQPAANALFAAASIGSSVPLHLIGASRRALGVPETGGMLGGDADPEYQRMYAGLRAMGAASAGRGPWYDAYNSTMSTTLSAAAEIAPAFTPTITGGDFVRKLTMAARLINRNLGFRVLDVGVGSFDTHDGEPGRHAALLKDLNDGIQIFYATLDPAYRSRVTMMTASEFGRTLQGNDSQGTDHGTANAHFVIGTNVRGGMYGQPPALTVKNQWDRLTSTLDFRSMYGSVLDGWLGGGGSTILNGGFQNLQLFNYGPGQGPAKDPPNLPIPVQNSSATVFTPLSPTRLIDTRDGTGGRVGALQPEEQFSFEVAGLYGVPTDAVAVVLNVTATEATGPTFFTVWATGATRPITSNLNPVPDMAVPNLVVSRTGTGGFVTIYNLKNNVHAVVDLVGYFRSGSSTGLVPLDPTCILDTRSGIGGVTGKVGQAGVVDLQVAGVAGVPGNATAAVLNVTVTEPDDGSYLLVYPSGEGRPVASSVNMERGQTVPNLVMAKLGTNGKVSIYNLKGNTHIVVDVLGSFVPGASGRFVAVGPSRLLDTRDGTGTGVVQRLGQAPLSLAVLGKVGIPGSGVGAVLLNVTAVEPTADTFVTVFPGGAGLPNASNLNAVRGQIVPNMVLARVGAGGTVQFANYAGDTDLVADVFGYFTT